MRWMLTAAILGLLAPAAFPATILVPDDFPAIQDAIDAAADGDTVIVRPGVYVENIDFKGKAITVKSEFGPHATTIDGNSSGSVVMFQSGEGAGSKLEGFRVTNGSGTDIWGLGDDCGGGICCFNFSSPVITGNIITENELSGLDSCGGGIYCYESSPLITSNVVDRNVIGQLGAGIFLWDSSSIITNNTITENTARSFYGLGGGICCLNSTPVVTNTILWGNDADSGPEIWVGDLIWSSVFTISFSDVEGGRQSMYVATGSTANWGPGMIKSDPLFVDPVKGDYHIPFDSPCRSTGDRNAPSLPGTDFESDPRSGLFAFPDMGGDEFHTHLYLDGPITSGKAATAVIVGWPQTNPVLLISGSGILPAPDPTPYGDLWLMPPWDHRVHFHPIPDSGVRTITRTVSAALPPGTTIPIQALVGTELSNLCLVTVE